MYALVEMTIAELNCDTSCDTN